MQLAGMEFGSLASVGIYFSKALLSWYSTYISRAGLSIMKGLSAPVISIDY